jgi:tetratricopeptide (TPR) repeat protein
VALEWSLSHDPQTGLLIAGANPRFWETRGYLVEGRRWLDSLLAVAPSRTVLRAKALYASGYFASRDGENLAAARLQEESLEIYTELGDQMGIAVALERLGVAIAILGDGALALSYLERSISLLKRIGYKAGLGWTLGSLGMYARIAGDYDRARDALNESLALTREVGDLHTTAYTLNHLGQLARVRGDYNTASRLLEECLEMSYTLKSKAIICWTLECLSTVERMRGDYNRAWQMLIESLEMARAIGVHSTVVVCIYSFGVLAVHYGSNLDAIRLFGAAISLSPYVREVLDADELEEWDIAYEKARAAVSEEAFAQAWSEGQAMTWDQATNLAPRVLDRT